MRLIAEELDMGICYEENPELRPNKWILHHDAISLRVML
jgi:hypothetical protein